MTRVPDSVGLASKPTPGPIHARCPVVDGHIGRALWIIATSSPESRNHPPTRAVVQVSAKGTATLYLGDERVEHAVGVIAAVVMGVLLDHAATLGTSVAVTTRLPDGRWDRHRIEPAGHRPGHSTQATSCVPVRSRRSQRGSGQPTARLVTARIAARVPALI